MTKKPAPMPKLAQTVPAPQAVTIIKPLKKLCACSRKKAK